MAGAGRMTVRTTGRRHGRCHHVMVGAGPPSTPSAGIGTARRGCRAFARHDGIATTVTILTPMRCRPAIHALCCTDCATVGRAEPWRAHRHSRYCAQRKNPAALLIRMHGTGPGGLPWQSYRTVPYAMRRMGIVNYETTRSLDGFLRSEHPHRGPIRLGYHQRAVL